MKNTLYNLLNILFSLFIWLVGGIDIAIQVLFTFMVLDVVTGVTKGYMTKTLSSQKMRLGFASKVMIFIVIIVANLLDRLTGQPVFRSFVCVFYIGVEGISIIENASIIGLPIPQKLKDALIQLKEGQRKENVNISNKK